MVKSNSLLLVSFYLLFNIHSNAQDIASINLQFKDGSDAHQDTVIFFGDTLTLCPASYDSAGNFLGNVEVHWHIIYGYGNLQKRQIEPSGCIEFVFSIYTPLNFKIVAIYENLSDTSWLIIVKDPLEIVGNFDSPKEYILKQNYPNPFNPSTKITFTLPKPEHVTLIVLNLLGQKVSTLLNTKINAGSHNVQFDAHDLPSGIYFYRIQAGKFSQVRKMVVFR